MSSDHQHHAHLQSAEPGSKVIDPVCGMTVDPLTTPHHAEHGGHDFHFCSAGCRTKFQADPVRYLKPTPPTPDRLRFVIASSDRDHEVGVDDVRQQFLVRCACTNRDCLVRFTDAHVLQWRGLDQQTLRAEKPAWLLPPPRIAGWMPSSRHQLRPA